MRFRTITALLTTATIFMACSDSATAPTPTENLEAELAAIVAEQSASPNDFAAAQDRRDGRPPRVRLTEEQRQCIHNAVQEFREANAETLAALHEIYQKAREARAAGATRAEVARILQEAKPLLERLRSAHEALQQKIRACLTT
jgi:hypothetical protein